MLFDTEIRPATPLEIYRRALGLTRAQLGELAAVHRETVARIERGDHVPHQGTARLLAAALEVEREALFPPAADDPR